MSRPLMVVHTCSAVATVSPRSPTVSNPALSAVRYRSVSRVAGSAAAASSSICRKSSSEVVTMFSISELACASSNGIVLMRTAGLGMDIAAWSSCASAALAAIAAFSTDRVSSTSTGGGPGKSLYGTSGRQSFRMEHNFAYPGRHVNISQISSHVSDSILDSVFGSAVDTPVAHPNDLINHRQKASPTTTAVGASYSKKCSSTSTIVTVRFTCTPTP